MQASSKQISRKQIDELGSRSKTQDAKAKRQCSANMDIIKRVNTNPMIIDKNSNKRNYSLLFPYQEADRRASAKLTQ